MFHSCLEVLFSVEGLVSGSMSAPIYSFGTKPLVHDVSSLAHVTSGSGIADNDADERTSNGGAFNTIAAASNVDGIRSTWLRPRGECPGAPRKGS